ncbi:MAG: hypothetical protein OQK71_05795 [Desulfobacter sp.]|nr:hypothetical protein [Desulfobacter sp.]
MCSHGLRLHLLVMQDPDYIVGKPRYGHMDFFKPVLSCAGKEGAVVAT